MIHDFEYDVFAVSETLLGPNIPSESVNISGYNLVRADRKSGSGGVAIYYRNTLEIDSSLTFTKVTNFLELLTISFPYLLNNYNESLMVTVIYRPPRVSGPRSLID